MNREQRRHPEKVEQTQQGDVPGQEEPPKRVDDEMLADGRQQDDFSVRAKNTGHGKKTADKWNQ